jgi:hypothetical protein
MVVMTEPTASKKYAMWPCFDMISIGKLIFSFFRIVSALSDEGSGGITSSQE